jgi:transposase
MPSDAGGPRYRIRSAVATRYEKHAANFLAAVKLAAARIWMRFMSR